MKIKYFSLLLLAALSSCSDTKINYGSFVIEKVAEKPPMGWNSWDVYGADVREKEYLEIVDYMSENLLEYGYEYAVIDIAWYAPNATAINERYKEPYPEQVIDEYGRLLPAPNKWPSCVNGSFRPIADYVHEKGLKFGIHVMRGIPRQAVEQDTPIKGSEYTARDIVMYEKTCSFYDGMLSIDMSKPGAQDYYNSLLELYAEWGVDFIKADDMTSYPPKFDEVKAFRYAMEQTDRDIVLSLSPGAVNSWDRSFLHHYADMYRISGDFWDEWNDLKDMFRRVRIFKGHTGPGGWADCDMIPLGIINIRGERGEGERMTRFTPDEQYTLMSLWSIFRSPLMLGMDLTRLDDFTRSLLTNKKVLSINQNSINNKKVFHSGELVIWAAQSPDQSETYYGIFNLGDETLKLNLHEYLPADLIDVNHINDIWSGEIIHPPELQNLIVNPHGVNYISFSE